MKLTVVGKNGFTPSESNREYAQEKVSKIEKYLDAGVELEARVVCKIYKNEYQKVEITIPVRKNTLRAEATGDNLYAAIDEAVDKLFRQVRKYRTRNQNKMDRLGIKATYEEATKPLEEEMIGEVVRTKRIALRPMGLEDAINEMELVGHSFYLFRDMDTEKINLIYLRQDGNYAVIETE